MTCSTFSPQVFQLILDINLTLGAKPMRQPRHGPAPKEITPINGLLQLDPFICRKAGFETPTTDREKWLPSLHIGIE